MADIKNLKDKRVAILATNGFEEVELTAPRDELSSYGAQVDIVSDEPVIKSWKNKQWGNEFKTDKLLNAASAGEYQALIIPGGVINSDRLRRNEKATELVKAFNDEHKLIAAICHGPQLLIEADLVSGKKMTAHRAIKKDMMNAGAEYEDFGVLIDDNFITARGSADVPSFLKKITSVLGVTH
jgi:protease I